MSLSVDRKQREEAAIIRIQVFNRNDFIVSLDPKYACLFHGCTELDYGEYTIRYPVRDTEKNRLVTQLQRDYPSLIVKEGVSGFEVI